MDGLEDAEVVEREHGILYTEGNEADEEEADPAWMRYLP